MQPRLIACAPSWGIAAAVAVAVLTAPVAANAASLAIVNPKPCFGAGDTIGLGGAGWQPGADISFTRDNTQLRGSVAAGPAGEFLTDTLAPAIRATRRSALYSATDNVSGVAAASVRLSRLGVSILPQRANPSEARRISARGFTYRNRRTLYSHRVRNGRSQNATIGRLRGQCKATRVRTPILRGAQPGTYRLQFDAFPRYRANRRQRIVFRVRVVRQPGRSSRAATTAGAAAFGSQGESTAIASFKRIR